MNDRTRLIFGGAVIIITILAVAAFVLKRDDGPEYYGYSYVKKEQRNLAKQEPQVYTSDELGISFRYLADQNGDNKADVKVTQKDNRVYLHRIDQVAESGQWVEVLSKDPNANFITAIKDRFLKGVSDKDCWVEVQNDNAQWTSGIIKYPINTDPSKGWWETEYKCPKQYSATNGIRYFYLDKRHADKLLFYDIGQYAIIAQDRTPWQETLQLK